jgi:hypothetical protein
MSQAVDNLLRLNGCPLSWGSTRSRFNGAAYVGVLEVNVEESREGELIHAQQPDGVALGITSGLYKVDSFSFKMLADTGEQMCQQLSLSFDLAGNFAGASFGDARFTYQLEMFEPNGPVMMITVVGCKIEKRKFATSKGSEALAFDFECKALQMQTTGAGRGLTGIMQQLWSAQRGLA